MTAGTSNIRDWLWMVLSYTQFPKWNIFLVSSISFLAIFADYDKHGVLKNILTMLKDTLELNYSNNVSIIYTSSWCIGSKKYYVFSRYCTLLLQQQCDTSL